MPKESERLLEEKSAHRLHAGLRKTSAGVATLREALSLRFATLHSPIANKKKPPVNFAILSKKLTPNKKGKGIDFSRLRWIMEALTQIGGVLVSTGSLRSW